MIFQEYGVYFRTTIVFVLLASIIKERTCALPISMIQHFHRMISAALGISEKQIVQTLGLLNDGATIPFISRYRKEVTGGLDEVQIESIKTHYEKLNEIAKRKETILNTIQEQGKLTTELQKRIEETWDNTLLEDIYLPTSPNGKHVPKQLAKGLEPSPPC